MTRYTGNHCPVCEQAFTDTDDIVVCPDCGTPYHRDCWKKVGACMHRSEHAAGFEWQPGDRPQRRQGRTRGHLPQLRHPQHTGRGRCSHCGCPLPRSEADSADAAKPEEQVPIYARDPSAVNNRSAAPGPHIETYSADREGGIYRREIGPEDTIDGIKARTGPPM